MNTDPALALLKRHEGFSALPYRDSVGVLTVGYGRNLEAHPFAEVEAGEWLARQYAETFAELARAKPVVGMLDEVRQAALGNMAFNLGLKGLLSFKRMWAAIEAGNWRTAAEHALDSKWATQVGHRALDIAEMLEFGEWP